MVAACPFPSRRGTPVRVEQTSQALARLGFPVHVVTYHLGEDKPLEGVQIHRTGWLGRWYRKASPGPTWLKLLFMDPLLTIKLWRTVKKHDLKAILAHHYEGAIAALIVRKFVPDLKVIYDAHTTLENELHRYKRFWMPGFIRRKLEGWLDRGIPRWCDHTLAVSDFLADTLLRNGAPRERVTAVPLAIRPGEWPQRDRSAERALRDIPEDQPLIAYTGNLGEFQGIDLLLEAFTKLRQHEPEARLVIAGKPLRDWPERFAAAGHDESVVRFDKDSTFENAQRWLAAASVVALPRPQTDGLPLKLVNAMSAGRPVVAFSSGVQRELRHGIDGWVARDDDLEHFVEGLRVALRDRERAEEWGAAAKLAAQRFDVSWLESRLDSVYQTLLGPPAPAPAETEPPARPSGPADESA